MPRVKETKKNKANFIQKYLTYFINFQKNANHKTFAVFGCPKVACSCDGARDFFRYSPVNNALSPLALMRGRRFDFVNLT